MKTYTSSKYYTMGYRARYAKEGLSRPERDVYLALLSAYEYFLKEIKLFKDIPKPKDRIFYLSYSNIKQFMIDPDISNGNLSNCIHSLIKKKWIKRYHKNEYGIYHYSIVKFPSKDDKKIDLGGKKNG